MMNSQGSVIKPFRNVEGVIENFFLNSLRKFETELNPLSKQISVTDIDEDISSFFA